MSNPIQPILTPTGEFQTHFGGPPGSADAVAECKKWEKLCGELLAERQKLSEELAKAQSECEIYRRSLFKQMCKDYKPDFDKEIGFAHLDDTPSVHDLIAEFENAPGK